MPKETLLLLDGNFPTPFYGPPVKWDSTVNFLRTARDIINVVQYSNLSSFGLTSYHTVSTGYSVTIFPIVGGAHFHFVGIDFPRYPFDGWFVQFPVPDGREKKQRWRG
jgi:hypothetical protein